MCNTFIWDELFLLVATCKQREFKTPTFSHNRDKKDPAETFLGNKLNYEVQRRRGITSFLQIHHFQRWKWLSENLDKVEEHVSASKYRGYQYIQDKTSSDSHLASQLYLYHKWGYIEEAKPGILKS